MLETCICKENSLQLEKGINMGNKKKNTLLPAYLTQVTESNTNTRKLERGETVRLTQRAGEERVIKHYLFMVS